MRRPAALALAAALAAAACTSEEASTCPGTPVATFRFKGRMVVRAGDPLDPVPGVLDCTPDPLDPLAPIPYPPRVAFEATLAADPATDAAALCRSNGSVLSGQRTAPSSFSVEAETDAPAAVLCSSCAATLRVLVAGDVLSDPGGGPATFHGILVEVLTEGRGTCDGCLPIVPDSDPPERACAARYELFGTED